MITKVLVANRGEIACRIMRTCRRLGIKSIAVYSSADQNSLHKSMADESICLGEPEAAHSYLNVDRLIEAAQKSGASALHPGYGFLSENADFVSRVEKSGITFIGPSAKSMRKLGDKLQAKRLATEAGVPLAPSIELDISKAKDTLKKAQDFARECGFPVMVKAAGGGGGRGMRRVNSADELETQMQAASREALTFFGDSRIFLEKYISPARHVEVQLISDTHENVIHLWDRDCSYQRQHQKVIEEAPAPGIPVETRERMLQSARALFTRAQYHGAGTAEFLLDQRHNVYFMEVNSRLQVEHPVTEMITGLDLVELQIQIAEGKNIKELLPLAANGTIPSKGAAIECRLCAESPEENFIASTGTLSRFSFPQALPEGEIRVDTGFHAGDTVTHYYDSLLAKIITWAPSRNAAQTAMISALDQSTIFGLKTNIGFLQRLISAKEFGTLSHHIQLAPTLLPDASTRTQELRLVCGLQLIASFQNSSAKNSSPWHQGSGFRIFGDCVISRHYAIEGQTIEVSVQVKNFSEFEIQKDKTHRAHQIKLLSRKDDRCEFLVDQKPLHIRSETRLDSAWVKSPWGCIELKESRRSLRTRSQESNTHSQAISSPLPGKIIAVQVKAGTAVRNGDTLLVIESMKMEHPIRAPLSGKVEQIMVKKGELVQAGATLLHLDFF